MLFITNIISQLKNNWPKIQKILKYLGLVVILLILINFIYQKCNRGDNVSYTQEYVNKLNQQIKVYKDDSGITHARLKEIDFDRNNQKVLYERQVDSLATALKIKSKSINAVTNVTTVTIGNGTVHVDQNYDSTKDSNSNKFIVDTTNIFRINDGFLNLKGRIKRKMLDYNYSYKEDLTIVQYSRNSGFLGLKKENYIDISSSNKNTEITNATNYVIKDKYVNFISLGVGAQMSYYNGNWIVTPGIGLYLDLFTIKRKK